MKSFSFVSRKSASILGLLAVVASWLFPSCNKTTPKTPEIVVSVDTLFFNGNETKSFSATLLDATYCDYRIDYSYGWVQVSPRYGYFNEGETQEIFVTSDLTGFLTIQESTLYILTQYETKCVTLIGIPDDSISYSLPDTLFFTKQDDEEMFTISNYGNVTLHYSVTSSSSFVQLSSTEGEVGVGETVEVLVTIDRENLLTVDQPELYVTIDDAVHTITLFAEKKMILEKDVADAEYSKATDLLVYAASDNTLNIYHPDTKETEVVPLFYPPICVSLSPDGTKAVVGHDAHVTYVDLISKAIINTNDIPCKPSDIVLANNGWTYVFPSSGYRILCLDMNLPNAPVNEHTGYTIYHNTKAKIHPSGKYIYGADNGASPADIEKYDIQNGIAAYLYDSPYHGDYATGGDLWLSEDGSRIYTKSGTVYKTSDNQDFDMIYNGRLMLESSSTYLSIVWLDQLESNHELFLLSRSSNYWGDEGNRPYVYVHNSENLIFEQKIRVEDYLVPKYGGGVTIYAANPYFVFANSNGQEIYVITKAVGSGLVYEWAIQTFNVE